MNGSLAARPYGPLTFAVTIIHLVVADLTTWLLCMAMWPFVIFVLPICLAYAAVGAVVARAPGRWGQIGRGMLLGTLAGPLSILIFVPAFAIASAIGPL